MNFEMWNAMPKPVLPALRTGYSLFPVAPMCLYITLPPGIGHKFEIAGMK